MGIVNMGVGLGLSIAGLLLPYCIGCSGPDGWRYAWYLMGTTVFAGSFMCYAFLRDHPSEKGLTPCGEDENKQARPRSVITLGFALQRILSDSEVWKLSWVYLMFGFSYMVYLTFFVAYLTKELNLEIAQGGRIFALLGFLSIFCGLPWGTLSDRIGRRNALIFAYLTLAVSFLLFAYYRHPFGVYASAAIFGLTGLAIPVIVAAAVSDAIGGQLASAAFGFATLFFGIGQALAPFVGGWIKDATGTFTNAFVLCALVALLGAFSSYFLKRRLL